MKYQQIKMLIAHLRSESSLAIDTQHRAEIGQLLAAATAVAKNISKASNPSRIHP
jgi:hypothetical protein